MKRLPPSAVLLVGWCCLLVGGGGVAVARGADDRPAAAGGDAPTIAKDSLLVTAFTCSSYKGDYKVFSWLPEVQFRVNGPIASGSQLWAEFKLPTGPWVKFDIKTEETEKGHGFKVENAGGRDIGEDKSSTYTGPVDFAIHLRNELAGGDTALFTGKCKVAKAHSNETGPDYAQHFVYYVDQDWLLPIGYVYLTPDDISGMQKPGFNAAFWVRGEAVEMVPHLFYKDKEVGKITLDGEQVGKPSASPDIELQTTQYVDDSLPQKARWARVGCSFSTIKAWDTTGDKPSSIPGEKGSMHMLKDNPGEYQVKVLWKGKLARVIKFTVRPDGTLDDGISKANQLGDDRAIVPVQIVGDQDGKWDHDAWKTDAFYGNPPKGFSAAP